MPRKVIKKDGSEEEFVPEKIIVSMVKAGAPLETARKVADEIQKIDKEKIATKEIRDKVLERVRVEHPPLEKKWLSYDKSVKRLYHRYKDGLYE